VKLDSIRRSHIGSVLVALAAALLGSCGGGGAASPSPQVGETFIQPNSGTFYAGVEYTFTIAGGRPPYTLSSSEPSLFAVPTTLNGNFFTVVPNNPGVIDADVQEGELPRRTVNLTAREVGGLGQIALAQIQVAQNFLTSYGVSFLSNCIASQGSQPPAACAGGETAVVLNATISGNIVGNREYRFEVLRGPFSWFFPNGQLQGGTISDGGRTVVTRTDHSGRANVWFRVNSNVATQLGAFRVTDVATGVSTTHVFTVVGTPIAGELEVIPDEITFTGATTAQCGTGSADVLVFNGTPPYRAVSAFGSILVTPDRSDSQPGRFTITASNPFVCVSDGTVTIFDANNNTGTVTITTETGSEDPPPPPVAVTPTTVTLQCGTSGSVTVVGGASDATFSVSSSDSRITAAISGRSLTVSRPAADAVPILPPSPTPGTPNPIQFQVQVTDGSSVAALNVTAPSHCPP
jgi:hypothetical protein